MSRQLTVTLAILACGLVPDRLSGGGASRLRASLKSSLLNRVDLEKIEHGYYQQLLEPSRRLDDLGDVQGLRLRGSPGSTWSVPFDDAPLVMRVDDLREVILKRNDDTVRKGVRWHTNDQGMRDQDYATVKPHGTFRIALVGDSIGAGWGVDVDQRFESILERAWNIRAQAGGNQGVEIINCAVPGHSPGQRWCHFSQVGWPLNPDLVIYESNAADVGWDERRLRFLLARGIGWDSPIFSPALARSGVARLDSPDSYRRALRPRHREILTGVYQSIAADCRARNVPIVWVLVPRVGRPNDATDQRALKKTAQDAGFARIIDVTDAYDGVDPALLAVDDADFHPNAVAHERLARRLDSLIGGLPELAHLWAPYHGRNTDLEVVRCVNDASSPSPPSGKSGAVALDRHVGGAP
jgi:hypothetical protein